MISPVPASPGAGLRLRAARGHPSVIVTLIPARALPLGGRVLLRATVSRPHPRLAFWAPWVTAV
jgi:hypothetical protein